MIDFEGLNEIFASGAGCTVISFVVEFAAPSLSRL